MEVETIGKSEKDNVTSLQQKSVESRIRKEVQQKGFRNRNGPTIVPDI